MWRANAWTMFADGNTERPRGRGLNYLYSPCPPLSILTPPPITCISKKKPHQEKTNTRRPLAPTPEKPSVWDLPLLDRLDMWFMTVL